MNSSLITAIVQISDVSNKHAFARQRQSQLHQLAYVSDADPVTISIESFLPLHLCAPHTKCASLCACVNAAVFGNTHVIHPPVR